jgi:hypothetical protein
MITGVTFRSARTAILAAPRRRRMTPSRRVRVPSGKMSTFSPASSAAMHWVKTSGTGAVSNETGRHQRTRGKPVFEQMLVDHAGAVANEPEQEDGVDQRGVVGQYQKPSAIEALELDQVIAQEPQTAHQAHKSPKRPGDGLAAHPRAGLTVADDDAEDWKDHQPQNQSRQSKDEEAESGGEHPPRVIQVPTHRAATATADGHRPAQTHVRGRAETAAPPPERTGVVRRSGRRRRAFPHSSVTASSAAGTIRQAHAKATGS